EEFLRQQHNKLKNNTEDIFQISDGLVIVCKIGIDFKELIELIAELQINFILERKKLIRGAISLGTISKELYEKYKNNKNDGRKSDVFLISDGLIKAFKLESEYVQWPVIATAEEVLGELRKIRSIYNENELFSLKRMFGTNIGFLYFIDFLDKLYDNEKEKFENFLEESIRKYENEKRIFEKYYWLLKYYKKKKGKPENNYLLSITGDEVYG
ncbi:MAG TPA: hypothetical protein DER56_00920, partial [Thermosipho africanus]|nr:hypothetical protein [Thermosipho africanus]